MHPMTPDYLAELVLIEASRIQREALADTLPLDLEKDYTEEPWPED